MRVRIVHLFYSSVTQLGPKPGVWNSVQRAHRDGRGSGSGATSPSFSRHIDTFLDHKKTDLCYNMRCWCYEWQLTLMCHSTSLLCVFFYNHVEKTKTKTKKPKFYAVGVVAHRLSHRLLCPHSILECLVWSHAALIQFPANMPREGDPAGISWLSTQSQLLWPFGKSTSKQMEDLSFIFSLSLSQNEKRERDKTS